MDENKKKELLSKLPLEATYIPAVDKGMTVGACWMLMLHGRGDRKESYEMLSREINVTGLHYLALNAPYSMGIPMMEGHSWYDEHHDPEEPKFKDSMTRILQSLNLLKEAGVAPTEIFVLGFSQGGRMALELLWQLEEPIGAIVSLSPRINSYTNFDELPPPAYKTPLFMAHGENDPVLPFQETATVVKKLRDQGASVEFFEFDGEHEIDIMEIIALRQWLNEYL